MIKIILPNNNRNDFNIVTDAVLEDVCIRLFGDATFEKEYENRSIGRYFKAYNEETNELFYIVFCNPANNSRNAHLLQFVPPAYRDYYNCELNNKHIAVYIIQPDGNDRTDYIKLFYRCFCNLSIDIINIDCIGISSVSSFSSFEEIRNERNKNRESNSHNESTYFEENDEDITIYGKTDGTNVNESFILALTLAQIVKHRGEKQKPILFLPVKEDLKDDYAEILRAYGITVEDKIEILPNGNTKPVSEKIDSIRNTKIYHYNLLKKFGEKRCYLCGCDIEHTIIGSHIERVADIEKNPAYSTEVKLQRAVDKDNGFWLCATHDKMFEYGIIYFDEQLLKIGAYISEPAQLEYINKSIFDLRKIYINDLTSDIFTIKNEDYNLRMKQYIELHRRRVA